MTARRSSLLVLAAAGAALGWLAWQLVTGVGVALAGAAYDWGITMVVAGSVFAVGGGLIKKPGMAAVGGFTMIGGFFCPWIDPGHLSGYDLARIHGTSPIAIAAWLVPFGGAITAYGANSTARGRAMAALGGLLGLAAIGYLTHRLMG